MTSRHRKPHFHDRSRMDLVTCDTATPLFFYDHPVWKKYAAATVNQFGKGSSLYLSSMFDGKLLEKVLVHYFASLPETLLAHPECHFPLIIREGVNDFGKRVRFYFNYSGEKQTAICKGISGTELLSGRKIMEQETLPLERYSDDPFPNWLTVAAAYFFQTG